jgi:hypothetical protein
METEDKERRRRKMRCVTGTGEVVATISPYKNGRRVTMNRAEKKTEKEKADGMLER